MQFIDATKNVKRIKKNTLCHSANTTKYKVIGINILGKVVVHGQSWEIFLPFFLKFKNNIDITILLNFKMFKNYFFHFKDLSDII